MTCETVRSDTDMTRETVRSNADMTCETVRSNADMTCVAVRSNADMTCEAVRSNADMTCEMVRSDDPFIVLLISDTFHQYFQGAIFVIIQPLLKKALHHTIQAISSTYKLVK